MPCIGLLAKQRSGMGDSESTLLDACAQHSVFPSVPGNWPRSCGLMPLIIALKQNWWQDKWWIPDLAQDETSTSFALRGSAEGAHTMEDPADSSIWRIDCVSQFHIQVHDSRIRSSKLSSMANSMTWPQVRLRHSWLEMTKILWKSLWKGAMQRVKADATGASVK